MLRNVLIREWVSAVYEGGKQKAGTGCYSQDFTATGVFHQWVMDSYMDGYTNGGTLTSELKAVVELPDGTVDLIHYGRIKFV